MIGGEAGDFGELAARWTGRGARLILGAAISLLAVLLSWAALLNVIIRDIPEPSSMAEELVTDLAVDIDTRGTADGSAQGVLATAREFIGNLLAPAWPIGLTALGVGFVLWAWGVVALARGKDRQPAES